MRLGMTLGMTGTIDMALVLEAERLGFTMVWCGESYGTDAVTPITWVLAQTTKIKAGTGIMQMHSAQPSLRGFHGNDTAILIGRSVFMRCWAFRATGGGRLARAALWQSADPHARIY